MFLYAVVLLELWGCCEKFSKFCHGELASLQERKDAGNMTLRLTVIKTNRIKGERNYQILHKVMTVKNRDDNNIRTESREKETIKYYIKS